MQSQDNKTKLQVASPQRNCKKIEKNKKIVPLSREDHILLDQYICV